MKTQTLVLKLITSLEKMLKTPLTSNFIITQANTACGSQQLHGQKQQLLAGQTRLASAANTHLRLALNKATKDYLDCPLLLLLVARASFQKMSMPATLCQLVNMQKPSRNLNTSSTTTGLSLPNSSLRQQTLKKSHTTLVSMSSTLSEMFLFKQTFSTTLFITFPD